MNFYGRYLSGETEKVYEEIYQLGEKAFEPEYFADVEKILTETFSRVAYNLEIIHTELININYLFKTNFEYTSQRPIHKPLPDTESLLTILDNSVKPFGFVPLSLKYFYRIVGGVNFVWDYETNETQLWSMADPIEMTSLDDLVSLVTGEYWQEEIQEYVDDETSGEAFLELAADVYHKDDTSGGPPYSLQITKSPSIDGLFLDEPHGTTFINYLRICMDFCGFPGIIYPDKLFLDFCQKVRPQLKKI